MREKNQEEGPKSRMLTSQIDPWLKELKQEDRLIFLSFTQIKLGHEYFKSYLEKLSAYEDNLCHICKVK